MRKSLFVLFLMSFFSFIVEGQVKVIEDLDSSYTCVLHVDTTWAMIEPAIPQECCVEVTRTKNPLVEEHGRKPIKKYRLQLCAAVNEYEMVPHGAYFRKEGCMYIMYSKITHDSRESAEREKSVWPKWKENQPFITVEYH